MRVIICAASVVPTRHGVQKPQLSWAKNRAKFSTTATMSRRSSNTMNAPAEGTSSNAIRRPNSRAARSVPDGPPTCTAWAATAPASSSTCRTVTPNGYS